MYNQRPTQFRDRIYLVLESGQLKIQYSTTNLSFFGADNFVTCSWPKLLVSENPKLFKICYCNRKF